MASASCAGPLPPLGSSPRAGSSPFEAGRAVVAEVPVGVEGFAFAVSVDNPNDTSLRTPAARVHLSTAPAVFGSFGQRFHRAPFHGFETLPARRFATTGQGRRAPGLRLLRMIASKSGARRERSRDGPLRRRERKRQRLSSPVSCWYRYVLAFIGLEVSPAAVRLSVRRTASCSPEEPWPHSGPVE
jgi:hypothetical protein